MKQEPQTSSDIPVGAILIYSRFSHCKALQINTESWNRTYLHLAHVLAHVTAEKNQVPTALREQRTQHSCPGNMLSTRFTSEKFEGRNPVMGPTATPPRIG